MVTVIKKGTSKQLIIKLLQRISSSKGLNAFKYCGIIRFDTDAVIIQKQMRDEWE
jgi:hypothetical protein